MDASVVVVGGINVDLKARSTAPLVPATSNPGRTTLSPGGVARNVAETIARLGTPVKLVSAVGDDALADWVLQATAGAGVDVSGVHRIAGHATGSYAAVLDADANLSVAVADMSAVESLDPDVVDTATIAEASLLVLDGNLAPAVLAGATAAAAEGGVPVIADPVSVPKAMRLDGVLRRIGNLTPNAGELGALTGAGLPLDAAIASLQSKGVAFVWVRLGADGSLLSGPDGTVTINPFPADPVDVTGAGDAMLGAYCHALLAGATRTEAATYGQAAAALTVASPHTVRPDLSDRLIRSLL